MKKIFTLLIISAFVVTAASAQTAAVKVPKRHYIHFAFATQQLQFDGFTNGGEYFAPETLKSDNGFAAEFGSTFFFNGKKPLAGMVRIGLDFSYLDAQYASFKMEDLDENGQKLDAHFVNLGMQIGPSVTVTPFPSQPFHAKAYVHYAPSAAAFSPSDWDNIKFGYAGYVTGGVQASYRFITVGVEMRSGKSDMKLVQTDDTSLEEGTFYNKDLKVNTKLPSTRILVGFRF